MARLKSILIYKDGSSIRIIQEGQIYEEEG